MRFLSPGTAAFPALVRHPALALALVLSGCTLPGTFPSLSVRPGEEPRVIQSGAARPAELAPAARLELRDKVAQERAQLATAEKAFDDAARALDAALGAASGGAAAPAAPGSAAWGEAQAALSRLDDRRAPFAALRARLAPLRITVDGLAAADPDRLLVERLVRDADDADAAARAKVAALGGRLAPG